VDVQGRLIEVLSGKTLDVFFRERIFEPLGMADTGFWVPPEKLERLACNYGADLSGALKVSDRPATSLFRARQKFLSGGGGLVSTARDYLRFCRMILNGGELDGRRLLKAETVAQMTRNQLPEKAVPISVGVLKMEGVGFGLGFSVRLTDQKDRPAGECGWGGAASTHFWISPKHELAVVALEQFMPFTARLDELVRPHVYAALAD
jgi:CubicO group peptidase (beta-lactamase class C family)